MDYTLSEVHEKIRQFSDKMGSDYFPLPVILNFFQTASYDFIGERLKYVEINQEITDDIRPLIISRRVLISILPDIHGDVQNIPNTRPRYAAAVPINYHRLVAYDVIYLDGDRCRQANLFTNSEYIASKSNPLKMPSKLYPSITQEQNLFIVDAGNAVPQYLFLTYCVKPSISTVGEPNSRIINLPDDAIEKILLNTVTRMYARSADERGSSNNQLEETFRKIFR